MGKTRKRRGGGWSWFSRNPYTQSSRLNRYKIKEDLGNLKLEVDALLRHLRKYSGYNSSERIERIKKLVEKNMLRSSKHNFTRKEDELEKKEEQLEDELKVIKLERENNKNKQKYLYYTEFLKLLKELLKMVVEKEKEKGKEERYEWNGYEY